MLDVAVAEVSLQRSRIVTLVGQRKATSEAQHVRVTFRASPAASPARSSMRANPAVVKGEPRSDVKPLMRP